jgi:hypothetical protein
MPICPTCQRELTDYDAFVHEISRLPDEDPRLCLPCRAEARARVICAMTPTFTEFEPWEREEDRDCLLTRASFESTVSFGGFIDYDGCGVLATATEKSDIDIWPSMLSYDWFVWPEWATHVVWYNR